MVGMKALRSKLVLKENLERNSKILRRSKKVKVTPQPTPRLKTLYLPRPDILHQYLRHREINQYLEYLQHRFPKYVKIHDMGMSHERRPLKAIEIDFCSAKQKSSNRDMPGGGRGDGGEAAAILARKKKRARSAPVTLTGPSSKVQSIGLENAAEPTPEARNVVFIEGGTHAREWITISVALNIIHQLTEKSGRHRDILDKLRFVIVPIVNPDGYEYSMDKNRFWRKNRRPQEDSKHIGADCNRNYDIFWDQGSTKAQRNTYRGDQPFSEPETRAIRNILERFNSKLLFFLSLHSYAQCIMYPWGFTNDLPSCWQHLEAVASAGRRAIREHNGRRYRCGSIARLQQHTISGSVVDYAFGVLKVPIALVMELPSPEYGFQPPLEAINSLGIESWLGIKAMCHTAHRLADLFQYGTNTNNMRANTNNYDLQLMLNVPKITYQG